VDSVSWYDATNFCRRLQEIVIQNSDNLGIPAFMVGSAGLPTEAEWEYACRAGRPTAYSFGDDPELLGEYAWFSKTSCRSTQSVGLLKPNGWGLHDMHGNLWEWCEDRYSRNYEADSGNDPHGLQRESKRLLRGGSWSYYAKDCRCASRKGAEPSEGTVNYGFRCLVRLVGPSMK
jgi:formylglycine-generating enzyme required for sulfatase activity